MFRFYDYSDFSKNWKYRHPIKIDEKSDSTKDILITIPSEWDEFWDNVDSDGNSVRFVTDLGGLFLGQYYNIVGGAAKANAKHKIVSWDYAGRSAIYRIEKYASSPFSGSSDYIIWIYWDNEDLGDDSDTFSNSGSAIDAKIYYGDIGSDVFSIEHDSSSGAPSRQIQKNSGESILIWVRASDFSERGAQQFFGDSEYAMPISLDTSTTLSGVSSSVFDGCFYDLGEVALIGDTMYYGLLLDGGVSGNNYLIEAVLGYGFYQGDPVGPTLPSATDLIYGTVFAQKIHIGVAVYDY